MSLRGDNKGQSPYYIKPTGDFDPQLYRHGLYEGKVVHTADPLHIGRVKISIPIVNDLGDFDVYGDGSLVTYATPIEALPWAWPCMMPGTFIVPEIGDTALVLFRRGDPEHPVYMGVIYGVLTAPEVRGRAAEALPPEAKRNIAVNLAIPSVPGARNDYAYMTPSGNDAPVESYSVKSSEEPTVRVFARTSRGHALYTCDEPGNEHMVLVDRLGQGVHFKSPVTAASNEGNASRRIDQTLDARTTNWESPADFAKVTSNARASGITIKSLSGQSLDFTPSAGEKTGVAKLTGMAGETKFAEEDHVVTGPTVPVIIGVGDGESNEPIVRPLPHNNIEYKTLEIYTMTGPFGDTLFVEGEILSLAASGKDSPALANLVHTSILPNTIEISASTAVKIHGVNLGSGQIHAYTIQEAGAGIIPTTLVLSVVTTDTPFGSTQYAKDDGNGSFVTPNGESLGGSVDYAGTITAGPTWQIPLAYGEFVIASYGYRSEPYKVKDDGNGSFKDAIENKPMGGHIIYNTGVIKSPPKWPDAFAPAKGDPISVNYQYNTKLPLVLRDDGEGTLKGDGSGIIDYASGDIPSIIWAGPRNMYTGDPMVPGEEEPIYAKYTYNNPEPWVLTSNSHSSEWVNGNQNKEKNAVLQMTGKYRVGEKPSEDGGAYHEINKGKVVLESAGGAKIILEGGKIHLNP